MTKLKIDLSYRTSELLKTLNEKSNNSRQSWIIMSLFSLIIFIGVINHIYSGNNIRIEVRENNILKLKFSDHNKNFFNQKFEILNQGKPLNNINSIGEYSDYKYESNISKEEKEINILKTQKIKEFDTVKVPIINISFSARDLTFISSIVFLLLNFWYSKTILKEKNILTQLIYPLTAKPQDEEAHILWGNNKEIIKELFLIEQIESNHSENHELISFKRKYSIQNNDDVTIVKSNLLNKKNKQEKQLNLIIEELKSETYSIIELLPSKFLILFSKIKTKKEEDFITFVFSFLPSFVLAFSFFSDIYFDFIQINSITNKTLFKEICDYILEENTRNEPLIDDLTRSSLFTLFKYFMSLFILIFITIKSYENWIKISRIMSSIISNIFYIEYCQYSLKEHIEMDRFWSTKNI
ncbi:hypothetical protein [Flammeovirga agarivorans]|uniref:Uncharacterized protein n=1 Tax=Flammeovirga agarivorans TaxID=2726742 RepID=A0A7X8SJK7_9BACT|nr:hypothetical protein [Flammeovirga agarivorans]NLR91449.1 hypothetical protein [Flammeovirga agarivorans]